MVVVLPFIDQPRIDDLHLRLIIGIPLATLGMIFRIYPLIYFKKMNTRPDLVTPSKLVTSGPYRIVRHPQYVAGIIFVIGWFVIWGGIYSLYIVPLLILCIVFQAIIEERYILEKEFGDAYIEYKKKVGMFLPKIWKKSQ
jgi:protein-S-isoprenylcysteine O-methyltransferase Ste14